MRYILPVMDTTDLPGSLSAGVNTIRAALRALPDTPGVYRMLDEKGAALYVGKARGLKSRVAAYTRPAMLPERLRRMIALTRSMEFVHTRTEAEALLLEATLIKKLKPHYNILLRDDKSFPFIVITGDHDFPLLTKHRGAKKRPGDYYGPFAGAGAVNRTIALLQRVFLLRNCADTVFKNRTRPCLQYHIKRCTAPCVGLVSKEEYAAQVAQARAFLEGKSRALQESMAHRMQAASAAQDYETAALYRDRIQALSAVQADQGMGADGPGTADVIALAQKEGRSCVQVFFFRGGSSYGNRAYFPRHAPEDPPERILSTFLAQFYENKHPPGEIILSGSPEDRDLLEEALSAKAGARVRLLCPVRGRRRKAAEFALRNAQAALDQSLAERAGESKLLEGLVALLELEGPPARIEVYDNSHIAGDNMVGAMIVAGPEGFRKSAYRKFNIRQAVAGDDYGMMREVLERRFHRAADEAPETKPDLVLIDGGKGQLSAAMTVLEDLGVGEDFELLAIAKGEDRNAGREVFHRPGKPPFQLPVNDPLLHYLQRLRDEAHRFAIGSHRARRQGQMTGSPLDGVPGIGARRKKALLHHFGSGRGVADAAVEDLAKVPGISKALAEKIYAHFH